MKDWCSAMASCMVFVKVSEWCGVEVAPRCVYQHTHTHMQVYILGTTHPACPPPMLLDPTEDPPMDAAAAPAPAPMPDASLAFHTGTSAGGADQGRMSWSGAAGAATRCAPRAGAGARELSGCASPLQQPAWGGPHGSSVSARASFSSVLARPQDSEGEGGFPAPEAQGGAAGQVLQGARAGLLTCSSEGGLHGAQAGGSLAGGRGTPVPSCASFQQMGPLQQLQQQQEEWDAAATLVAVAAADGEGADESSGVWFEGPRALADYYAQQSSEAEQGGGAAYVDAAAAEPGTAAAGAVAAQAESDSTLWGSSGNRGMQQEAAAAEAASGGPRPALPAPAFSLPSMASSAPIAIKHGGHTFGCAPQHSPEYRRLQHQGAHEGGSSSSASMASGAGGQRGNPLVRAFPDTGTATAAVCRGGTRTGPGSAWQQREVAEGSTRGALRDLPSSSQQVRQLWHTFEGSSSRRAEQATCRARARVCVRVCVCVCVCVCVRMQHTCTCKGLACQGGHGWT